MGSLSLGLREIVLDLEVQPELRRRAERQGQSHCHFGAHAGSPVQDGGERLSTYMQGLGSARDPHPHWIETHLPQDCAGMRRVMHLHTFTSVVILMLHILDPFRAERKRDPPVRIATSGV